MPFIEQRNMIRMLLVSNGFNIEEDKKPAGLTPALGSGPPDKDIYLKNIDVLIKVLTVNQTDLNTLLNEKGYTYFKAIQAKNGSGSGTIFIRRSIELSCTRRKNFYCVRTWERLHKWLWPYKSSLHCRFSSTSN
jgi:hypothetical protein